jgi:DNA topoisomerase-1
MTIAARARQIALEGKRAPVSVPRGLDLTPAVKSLLWSILDALSADPAPIPEWAPDGTRIKSLDLLASAMGVTTDEAARAVLGDEMASPHLVRQAAKHLGLKDVSSGSSTMTLDVGVGTRIPTRTMVYQRSKRSRRRRKRSFNEEKVRHVRTHAGEEFYNLPIGSPIVSHPHAPDIHQMSAPEAGEGAKPVLKMRPATDEDRKRLKIPPAWKDVKVNQASDARLLATGTDDAGRKQSIYSAAHHQAQAAAKFGRMAKLAEIIEDVDAQTAEDSEKMPEAASLLLMLRLGMRPGSNADTGAAHEAFGATNLRMKHVHFNKESVTLEFVPGKKHGEKIRLNTKDPDVWNALVAHYDPEQGPNADLFPVSASRVEKYFKAQAPGFKLKDLRTFHANEVALSMMQQRKTPPKTLTEYKKRRNEIGDAVAAELGNTRTVALASYVNPMVFQSWRDRLGIDAP